MPWVWSEAAWRFMPCPKPFPLESVQTAAEQSHRISTQYRACLGLKMQPENHATEIPSCQPDGIYRMPAFWPSYRRLLIGSGGWKQPWPIRSGVYTSRPVFDGIHREYQDIPDALFHYPPAERADSVMAFEVETPLEFAASLSRADVTAVGREFEKRRVWRGSIRREQICT